MRRLTVGFLLAILTIAIHGCGGAPQQNQTAEAPTTTTATPEPAATEPATPEALPTVSKYDEGPRAGEAPVNAALAATGEKVFQAKGCTVCHGFGKKVTGPDLLGVSMRRTAAWMEQQILHPEVMIREDPISRELKEEYKIPMTNQGLTPEEAKAVVEFLKHKDREAGVKKPA